MKPVENVSIGGFVFCLEDDASALAREYLSELETFYSEVVSGSEVMEGIEERMSELLLERCGKGGVVTRPVVEAVIATLGRPEAIKEESGEPAGSGSPASAGEARSDKSPEELKVKRKLYRDPSEGKVAGVCAGLGMYLGVDSTAFRILFVILTLAGCGFFFNHGRLNTPSLLAPVLYAILWICMPVAKTVRQRDEMRGEKGTVDAISAKVMSASREVEEAARNVAKSDSLRPVWRILAICIGITFLVTGVAGVVSLGCLTIGNDFLGNTFFLNRLVEEVANEAPVILEMMSYPPLVISLAVTLVIPFIALIYLGIMLLFDLKAPSWRPGLCLLVVWLVAVSVLAVLCVMFLAMGSL
ncbi:MAG: PspC domain-containing protein [Bacteroidales bacterium]|nr:PspC domain-containing protein [Bacteroidales bacterium]